MYVTKANLPKHQHWLHSHHLVLWNIMGNKSIMSNDSTISSVPANILTTDSSIFSIDCTGLHLSAAVSYPRGSSPGE